MVRDAQSSARTGNASHDNNTAATPNGTSATTRRKSVGRLIGAFKTVSTKHINRLRNAPGAVVWQRNFWDWVVRDGEEMDRIRLYIRNNAANWPADPLNS